MKRAAFSLIVAALVVIGASSAQASGVYEQGVAVEECSGGPCWPVTPQNLAVEGVTTTTASASWVAPFHAFCEYAQMVSLSEGEPLARRLVWARFINLETSYPLAGLRPGTVYTFSVVPIVWAGQGEAFSASVSFTTKPAPVFRTRAGAVRVKRA